MPEAVEWPSSLAWVWEELKEGKFQEFITTAMDSGHAKTRPRHSGFDALAGEVRFEKKHWDLLQAAIARSQQGLFQANLPTGDAPRLILLENLSVKKHSTPEDVRIVQMRFVLL